MKKKILLLFSLFVLAFPVFFSACDKTKPSNTIYLQYSINVSGYFSSANVPNQVTQGEDIVLVLGELFSAYSQSENFSIYIDDKPFAIEKQNNGTYLCTFSSKTLTAGNYFVQFSNIEINTYTATLYADSSLQTVLETQSIRHFQNISRSIFTYQPEQREGYDVYIWHTGTGITNNQVTGDVAFYVEYLPKKYKVSFYNAYGGVIKESYVEYGTSAIPPEEPTKDRYRFVGWSEDISCITKDTEVYPQFEKLLTVQLYTYEGGALLDVAYVAKGENYVCEKVPTLPGLVFDGVEGNTENLQEDSVFYVRWAGKPLYITYALKEGESFANNECTQTVNTQELFYAYKEGLPLLTPIKQGFYFSGWKTQRVVSANECITYVNIQDSITEENGEVHITLQPKFTDENLLYNTYEKRTINGQTWAALVSFKQLKNGNTFEVPASVWIDDEELPVYGIYLGNVVSSNVQNIIVDCKYVDFSFAENCVNLQRLVIGEKVEKVLSRGGFNTSATTQVEIIFLSTQPKSYGTNVFAGIKNYIIKVPASALEGWKEFYKSAVAYEE